MGVSLHLILLCSALDVVNDQFSLVVNSGDVADADRRGLERGALQSKLFLPFAEELQLAAIQLVDVEDALRARAHSKEAEAGALRNPINLERRAGQALRSMLNDLGCFSGVHLNFKSFKFI